MIRFAFFIYVAALLLFGAPGSGAAEEAENSGFQSFLRELWPDAQARGVTRATFDAAFAGLTPDQRVMALTRRQPEYGKPVATYLEGMVSKARIDAGSRHASQWSKILAETERQYGVDPLILLAIWGIETAYGAHKDRWDVIRSLATLAQARYRHPYFRNELLAALKILQEGHVTRDKFLGSWAGAMGQPQFMPSNFFEYAVDASGDGRRDIWTNVPDVLGSMANYLRKEGWNPEMAWGFEVVVPKGFDYRRSRASFQDWRKLGLTAADGRAFPQKGEAILFFPSGAAGPAFLVTENFIVIKRYNNSDVYALAAGQLADRLRGLGPIRAAWPADDQQLSREQRIWLQRKLAELGYTVKDFQGRIDFDLRDAIRAMQGKLGMQPDGHPTERLLERLKALR